MGQHVAQCVEQLSTNHQSKCFNSQSVLSYVLSCPCSRHLNPVAAPTSIVWQRSNNKFPTGINRYHTVCIMLSKSYVGYTVTSWSIDLTSITSHYLVSADTSQIAVASFLHMRFGQKKTEMIIIVRASFTPTYVERTKNCSLCLPDCWNILGPHEAQTFGNITKQTPQQFWQKSYTVVRSWPLSYFRTWHGAQWISSGQWKRINTCFSRFLTPPCCF